MHHLTVLNHDLIAQKVVHSLPLWSILILPIHSTLPITQIRITFLNKGLKTFCLDQVVLSTA